MIKNILRIFHGIVIVGLIVKIINNEVCDYTVCGVELALTLMRSVFEGRMISRHTGIQIILTCTLGYLLFPNKARFVSWLFLFKGIEVHQALKSFGNDWLTNKSLIYIRFFFDCARFITY